MKRIASLGALALALAVGIPASAALVDDFSGDLSNYTKTVILDANGGGSNTSAFEISGGALQQNTSTYDGIEQTAFIYNGLTLAVGEELQAAFTHNNASQDIGLYVGGIAPVTGVRSTYIAAYARNNGRVYSRGFNGASELPLADAGVVTYDKLFIARIGVNDYETGYYDGATRVVLATRTGMTDNDAEYVGFYTDVRGAGVLGTMDNLTIIPEPGSVALLGLGALGMLRRRRSI